MPETQFIVEEIFKPQPIVIANDFERIMLELQNKSAPLEASKQAIVEAIREQFLTHGHGTWPDWAESYYANATENDIDILRRTDALFQAATASSSLFIDTEDIWFNGSDLPGYARYHQTGTSKMPVREWFPDMDGGVADTITAIFAVWLDSILGGFGITRVEQTASGSFAFRGASGRFVARPGFIPSS